MSVIDRLKAAHSGSDAKLRRLKYRSMRSDIWAYYRGAGALFYQDLPVDGPLAEAPLVWACGDLQPENYGAYVGDDGLAYFDIIHFDKSGLAPVTWEVARFVTSLLVAAQPLAMDDMEAISLCRYFLESYCGALGQGHASCVQAQLAKGETARLLQGALERGRRETLDLVSERHGQKRRFLDEQEDLSPIRKSVRSSLCDLLDKWRKAQSDSSYFKPIDVVRYGGGADRFDLPRYLVLVEGKGTPNRNRLIDLSLVDRSAIADRLGATERDWPSPAQRVVALQTLSTWKAPPLLAALDSEQGSFVMREWQPRSDRVRLERLAGKWRRLERLVGVMGEVAAWDHLRAAGREGSAGADDLISFAQGPHWRDDLLDYARRYQEKVVADYAEFCAAPSPEKAS